MFSLFVLLVFCLFVGWFLLVRWLLRASVLLACCLLAVCFVRVFCSLIDSLLLSYLFCLCGCLFSQGVRLLVTCLLFVCVFGRWVLFGVCLCVSWRLCL